MCKIIDEKARTVLEELGLKYLIRKFDIKNI